MLEHPLCAYCAERGIVQLANICDHVEPHHGDINKFWLGKLQSLCKPCHDGAKREIELHGYRRDIGLDGYPLDPNHPCYWHERKKTPVDVSRRGQDAQGQRLQEGFQENLRRSRR